MANAQFLCQECGCHCTSCRCSNSLHLHREIEQLKREVRDRDFHIVRMETSVMVSADKYPNGEYAALNEEMHLWQDRYERLLENHRKLQRVNQGLEDKLLKIVDKYETEKNALNRDIANLTSRLVEARISLAHLEEENEQYRNDCNIAIQLLQCKPSNFVAHKLDSFPVQLQQRAKLHLGNSSNRDSNHSSAPLPEVRTIRVPIPTFPPTAMVYSVSNGDLATLGTNNESGGGASANGNLSSGESCNDIVSAAIMAKVLEEREKERRQLGAGTTGPGGRGHHQHTRSSSNGAAPCRCRRSSWLPEDDVAVCVEVSCQTNWSVSPLDGPTLNVQCTCGRLVAVPSSPTAGHFSAAPPGGRVAGLSTAAVHATAAKRLEADMGVIGGGGRRQWTRSGSSTSTETDI